MGALFELFHECIDDDAGNPAEQDPSERQALSPA